jgi:formylglycine-generating enzyme required for sulfatase activity
MRRVASVTHLLPEMVRVPSGEFLMGSPGDEIGRLDVEGPLHTVTIRRPFEVGAVPVTVAQLAAFADATAHPAEGIADSGTAIGGALLSGRFAIPASFSRAATRLCASAGMMHGPTLAG